MDSRDEFASFWEVIKFVAPLIGKVIGNSLKVVGEIAGVVITLIGKVLGAIQPLLNTAIDGINKIITGVNLIKPGADIGYIPKIGSTGGSTATGALGNFSMSTGTVSTPTTTVASSGGATSTTTGGNGSTGIAGVTTAVAAAAAIGSFNVGSFRMAEARTSGDTYNINVTGALDKEGVARQIVEIINESSYRGGGGAGSALLL
jgi:phage-related protein